ncbi:MAG: 1-acyl-sn-glycerol-3-phosphate acyltransferase [Elusimicrobia bacterium]|nr:1-acyl-sn-glycerol-3-phosphate acyltransferase [Elusimicrobiota bacterium]
MLDFFLRLFAKILFKLLFDIQIEGTSRVPDAGPVILASNHPTYLDPAFIMHGLKRPVRFLAWEKPFQVPVLGNLIRRYGAIPVNTQKPGRASFEQAAKVLRAGEVFGIFPEGGRSDFGTMNPLKSGVARLAMMTGAPVVPITILGGYRVWPKDRLLPRTGPVSVRFHPPIYPQMENKRDKEYEKDLVARIVQTINQSLLPSLRAEGREDRIYQSADLPFSWNPEGLPYLFFLLAWVLVPHFHVGFHGVALGWLTLYGGYLLLHRTVRLGTPWTVGLRHLAPWIVWMGLFFAWWPGLWTYWFCALIFLLICLWLQTFRFSFYRRFRWWALLLGYGLLFVSQESFRF